jgi:hypothetical protein
MWAQTGDCSHAGFACEEASGASKWACVSHRVAVAGGVFLLARTGRAGVCATPGPPSPVSTGAASAGGPSGCAHAAGGLSGVAGGLSCAAAAAWTGSGCGGACAGLACGGLVCGGAVCGGVAFGGSACGVDSGGADTDVFAGGFVGVAFGHGAGAATLVSRGIAFFAAVVAVPLAWVCVTVPGVVFAAVVFAAAGLAALVADFATTGVAFATTGVAFAAGLTWSLPSWSASSGGGGLSPAGSGWGVARWGLALVALVALVAGFTVLLAAAFAGDRRCARPTPVAWSDAVTGPIRPLSSDCSMADEPNPCSSVEPDCERLVR